MTKNRFTRVFNKLFIVFSKNAQSFLLNNLLWGCSKVLLTKINALKYINHHPSIFALVLKSIFHLVISYCSKAKFWGSKFHRSVPTKVCMFAYINLARDMVCAFPASWCASLLFLARGLLLLFPEQRHQAKRRARLCGCSQGGGWREHRTTISILLNLSLALPWPDKSDLFQTLLSSGSLF